MLNRVIGTLVFFTAKEGWACNQPVKLSFGRTPTREELSSCKDYIFYSAPYQKNVLL